MKQLLCLLLLSAFWLPLSALAEAVPPPVPAIAVRMVHPDNQELAGKGKPVPEGYTACVHEFRGNDGEMKRTRLFVKDTPSSRKRMWSVHRLIRAVPDRSTSP